MTTMQRPGSGGTCARTLEELAKLRLEASHEADASRFEARLSFVAACYDAILADAARPARAARLRFARAIVESHERSARAFLAAANDGAPAAAA